MTLSADQVAVMNGTLAAAPPHVVNAAAKVARGEVVPDADAEAVVAALADQMLSNKGFNGEGLTSQGMEIDDIIGIVQQMSEGFYR
jgi:hypothetical protein